MKSYIKLLVKSICVTAPLWGAAFYCSTHLLHIAGSDYVGAIWNKDVTNTTQDKYYDVLILGDSTANAAYIPEVLSESTLNLALAGSGTIDGYYTLKDYLEHNDAPTDVFISYMDYHLAEDYFTWDVSNYVHKYTLGENLEIYRMIEYVAEYDISEIASANYWIDVLNYTFWSPTIYSYSMLHAIDGDRREANLSAYEDVDARYGRYCMITNEEYHPDGIMGYSTFYVSPLQDQYYKMIVDLCDKNDIKVHMVKLPLSTDAGFVDDYEQDLYGYYDTLLSDYDNADFYWFHTTYENEFFKDEYHMNNHGAFRFSRELKELYPELFQENGSPSSDRMLAFDRDVSGENYLAELSKWINNKSYTIVYLDTTENLGEYYYLYAGYDNKDVKYNDVGDTKYAVYTLSADSNDYLNEISILPNPDGGLQIAVGEEMTVVYPLEEKGISFVVIDNENNKIVCERQSLFTENGFSKIL